MVRWVGVGLVVTVLVLAGSELSCLAGDTPGGPAASPPTAAPAPGPVDGLPVDFEVDHTAPGAGPVLTR
jgi:hypothetical protein